MKKAIIISFFFGFVVWYVLSGTDSSPSSPLSASPQPSADRRSVPTLLVDDREPLASSAIGTMWTSDDPFRGDAQAPVTIVEFSDFECPYCREAAPIIARVMDAYPSLRFQYRDFPIGDAHPHAVQAAEAGACAHQQGKFWAYHDILFANQDRLTRADLGRYAAEIGLDLGAFNQCIDGQAMRQEVLEDLNDGIARGVSGTPTFFINGTMYEGALSFEDFQELIGSL